MLSINGIYYISLLSLSALLTNVCLYQSYCTVVMHACKVLILVFYCGSMPGLICSLCPYEVTARLNLNLTNLLKHIQSSFSIICGLYGCQRKFRNFKVFWNHVSTFHSNDPNICQSQHVLTNNVCDENSCSYNSGGDDNMQRDLSVHQESESRWQGNHQQYFCWA